MTFIPTTAAEGMWHVIELKTGRLIGRYATLRRAQACADRKNMEYGAHAYAYKWVAGTAW